jgi:hypothetical protein
MLAAARLDWNCTYYNIYVAPVLVQKLTPQ